MTDTPHVAEDTRDQILELVGRYYRERHAPPPFDPHRDPVRYAGRVFGEEELRLLVDSSLDFYLTASRFTEEFEAGVADYLGLSDALFVNSGSSANLVALTALTSPKLGTRRLRPGDEVITVAAGFPSTVAPIVQNGLVPVFVDVRLGDYNADPDQLRAAVSPRTRAIVLAHTLGVPFDLDTVMGLVEKHDLWLVEDNCDALGSRFRGRLTGTFGHLATSSFYPAHHITTGEGGMVVTDVPTLTSAAGIDDLAHGAVVEAMRHDKKRSGAGLAVVIPNDDWSLVLASDVTEAEAYQALDELPGTLEAARGRTA